MKKKVLIILFLSAITFVGSKAFIALFFYQTAEKVQQSLNQEFAITYKWLSSELDGSIVFHNVSITPYRLKRTFLIDRLVINYGNYLNVLLNLPNLMKGEYKGVRRVSAHSVTGALEGRDLEQLIALEYSNDFTVPLGLYACGKQNRVDHTSLRHMGLDQFDASFTVNVNRDIGSDELSVSMSLDMGVLGKALLNSSWKASSIPDTFFTWDMANFQLNALTLNHVENGYFRRLSNFCALNTQLNREQFSLLAAEVWRKELSLIGFELGKEIEELYHNYLLQGGQLSLTLSPSKSFVLGAYEALLNKNLISTLGITAKLNNVNVPLSELYVNGLHFKPALAPAKEKKPDNAIVSPDVKKGYLPIVLTEIDQSLERTVRIEMQGGKRYEGKVVSINQQTLELSQLLGGGTVVYSLARDRIINLEIWY